MAAPSMVIPCKYQFCIHLAVRCVHQKNSLRSYKKASISFCSRIADTDFQTLSYVLTFSYNYIMRARLTVTHDCRADVHLQLMGRFYFCFVEFDQLRVVYMFE